MASTLFQRQQAQRDAQNESNNDYYDFAGELKNPVQIPLPPEDLAELTLAANDLSAAASQGTVIGAIEGKSAGSSLAIVPADPRFAISGTNLAKGATAITEGTYEVSIEETLQGALNSPRYSVVEVVVGA